MMKKQIFKFVFMGSLALSVSGAGIANAAWDTGGVIPQELLDIYNDPS